MDLQLGALGFTFDARQHDPTQSAGQLPVGRHLVHIVSGQRQNTKANDGSGYLELKLAIIEGPNTGMTGTMRLNIHNKSETAMKIAFRDFSAICHVVGIYQVNNINDIAGRPFMVQVVAQVENPQYTEISKILDVNGNEPKAGQFTNAAPQQQAPPQQQYAAPHGGTVVQQPQQQYQAPPQQRYAQPPQEQAPPPQMQQAPPTTQWGAQAPPQGQWGPQGAPPTPTWGAPPQ